VHFKLQSQLIYFLNCAATFFPFFLLVFHDVSPLIVLMQMKCVKVFLPSCLLYVLFFCLAWFRSLPFVFTTVVPLTGGGMAHHCQPSVDKEQLLFICLSFGLPVCLPCRLEIHVA